MAPEQKILVTGGSGLLGKALIRLFGDGPYQVLAPSSKEMDVTCRDQVKKVLAQFAPRTVIHAAAYTDIDGCERNPLKAYLVNTWGAYNVAAEASKAAAQVIYISTDYVFDGGQTIPYLEDDLTNPLNVYGRSKRSGEELVRDLCSNSCIVRTSGLFGQGDNFVRTILRLAAKPDLLRVVEDQVCSPTYALDLAQGLAQLIETQACGTYHVTNGGQCSWYEYAEEILKQAGISKEIIPIKYQELGRPSPRSAYSVLKNHRWEHEGYSPLRPWREALQEYLEGERGDP